MTASMVFNALLMFIIGAGACYLYIEYKKKQAQKRMVKNVTNKVVAFVTKKD